MLQLWCVARDGRRWKLEFNVREQAPVMPTMNVGIDLGTTNSALAWIDPARGGRHQFPSDSRFRHSAAGGAGRVEAAAHAALVPVSGRRAAGGHVRARTGRDCADAAGAFREDLAVESGCRSHREDPAVGCAGERARAVAGGSFGAVSGQIPRGVGRRSGDAAGGTGHRADRAGVVRRRGARTDGAGGRARRGSKADAARRAGGGVLFVDREQSGAIAEDAVRWADGAGLRRRRRHQRFHPDPGRRARATRSISRAPRWASICCWAATIWISRWRGWWRRSWAKQLSIRQRSGLRRQCSAAKERLLGDPNLAERGDYGAGQRARR